jgi:hypothetical protein
MFAIGGNYEYGIHGVEKDIPTAIDWYRKAAAAGSGMAMNHLGKMYDEGTVVERDVSEAGTWYRKAASAGVDSAKQWLDQHTQAIVKISSYDNWGEQLADLNAVHDWQLSQVIHAADGGNLAAELRAHNDQASQYQAAAERAAVLKDSRNALTKDEFETTDQFNARCTQVDQNLQAAEAEALKLKTSLDASTVPQTRRAIEATLTLPVRLKVKTDVTYNADKQEFTGALSLFESGFIKDPVEDYKVSISIEGITQATPSLVVSGVPDVENARIIKQGLQDGLVLAGWASFTDEVSQTENSVLDRALLGPLFFTHHKISLKFVGKVTYQLQTLDGQSIVPSDIEQKLVIQVLDQ